MSFRWVTRLLLSQRHRSFSCDTKVRPKHKLPVNDNYSSLFECKASRSFCFVIGKDFLVNEKSKIVALGVDLTEMRYDIIGLSVVVFAVALLILRQSGTFDQGEESRLRLAEERFSERMSKLADDLEANFNKRLKSLADLAKNPTGNVSWETTNDVETPTVASLKDKETIATPRPTLKRVALPRHVLFSTTRRQKDSNLEQIIAKNTRLSMMALPRVILLFFSDDNKEIGKNAYGFPYLKDMYLLAKKLVPDADTYSYSNNDLIFNASFVETADAVVYAARAGIIKSRFLVVGHRWNVNWNEKMIIGDYPEEVSGWDFNGVLKTGQKFQNDAQDYFITSPDIWDWNTFPLFVIGRVAYDNWIVNHAVTNPDISPIDASETCPVIHQTGPAGNHQGHQTANQADKQYNTVLGAGNWKQGFMSSCRYETKWGDHGKIIISKR